MRDFSSGKEIIQGYYKSFQPEFVNRQWQVEDMEIQSLLSKADRQIGRLDMFSEYIPNIELYISMHIVKEATKSSKIEGTHTKIEEALMDEKDIPLKKRDDWEEVQNYIHAMNLAKDLLGNLPLSSRLIKQVHRRLLQGVRGEHKNQGEFRKSQNWIGGASLQDAIFIPPEHHSIPDLMADLEKFIHNDNIHLPEIIRAGIMHYQFETIHPFLDGNGRVGRLMIPLYLVDKKILKLPILYLSDFFEKNRQLYYDNLMRVRRDNDMKQWLKFFLVGIIQTAQSGIKTFDSVLKLQRSVEDRIRRESKRNKYIINLMSHLYENPLIDAKKVSKYLNISAPTAYKIIDEMGKMGILVARTNNKKRGKKYVFEDYIKLFIEN